jgi:hypothetical protein
MKKLNGLFLIGLALVAACAQASQTYDLDDMQADDAYQDPLVRDPYPQPLLRSRGKLQFNFPLGMVNIPEKYAMEPDNQFLFMHGELFDMPAGNNFEERVSVAQILGSPAYALQRLAEKKGWQFDPESRFERGQVVVTPGRQGDYIFGVVLGFRPLYDSFGKKIMIPSAGKWLVQVAPFQWGIFDSQDLGSTK